MAKEIINREHSGVFRENPATGHNHTYYSISDAPQTPKEYVARCKEMGFKSIALNDHGTLLGVHPFMDACKAAGINGIPGVEAYSKVCPKVLERLEAYSDFLRGRTHLIINPMNYKGYQSICYAQRDASANIEKLKKLTYPIMTCEMLETYFRRNDNVFATSACVQGAIGYILRTNERLQKKYEKEEKICSDNKASYDAYTEKHSKLTRVSDALKEIKKEQTRLNKSLTPAFKTRMEKAKGKVDVAPDGSDKQKKAREAYYKLYYSYIEAENNINAIIAKVDQLSIEKDALKLEVAEYKKMADKYIKAKQKIDSIPFIPEEELYQCAKIQLAYYKSIFRNFFIEVQYHCTDGEEYVMPILVRLAEETNTPLIAANDAHISRNTEKDLETRRIIRYNYFERAQETDDADREMYIKSDWELFDALSTVIPEDKAKEAILNTDIFNQCSVVFPEEKHYPSVKTSETFEELLAKARQKMIDKGEWDDVYEKRYVHEIKTITDMGYIDYHMVVRDFCNMARKIGQIPREKLGEMPQDFSELDEWMEERGYHIGVGVGPGRGSAAGSLVCYLLGITNVDPIKYNLLFERFLNPERVSMPDIDSDIKTSIRPYIIKYLRWKFGENAVCSIATETTYAARASVLMAGRERGSQLYSYLPDKDSKPLRQKYMYENTLKVSDAVSEKPGTMLADCEKDFLASFEGNKEANIIWEHAKLIEGKLSGTGVHAGGVIISDNDNICDYIALSWNENRQVWAAQCDMIKAEEIGLLKMDLLGLNTLDCTSDCIYLVKKHKGDEIHIDDIPFEPEVFENIYSTGNTNSVFQFESGGMKSMLKEFKPTCFEDIIVLVACYRPGPMQYLPKIIGVKSGKEEVSYRVPELESILCTTYGATVYQEQVMQIFQKLAGYSLGAADMVRRAMSKKNEKKLAIERKAFVDGDEDRNIDGCVKRGISAKDANVIFDEMMDFAKYAFNKSHAAAYAVVSYQTAWLKYHYPVEFQCSMFNNKNLDSYEPLYADCKNNGIKVLPPDINHSQYEFTIEDDGIRYGYQGINGFGAESREFVEGVWEKSRDKEYQSIQDFLKRNLVTKKTSKGVRYVIPGTEIMETLIESGCFDPMGYNRKALLDMVGSIYTIQDNDDGSRTGSYDAMCRFIDTVEVSMIPVDHSYNMEKEMEYMKTILSENMLDKYMDDEYYECTPISELKSGDACIFGFVLSAELKKSARGNNLILMNVQGKTGTCTVMAMGQLYETFAPALDTLEHHVVKITGSVNDGGSMFARSINDLSVWRSNAFCMVLKTKEEIEFAKNLRYSGGEEKDIAVAVQFYYTKIKGTDEYRKVDVPKVGVSYFSKDELDQIQAKGIEIKKWDEQ